MADGARAVRRSGRRGWGVGRRRVVGAWVCCAVAVALAATWVYSGWHWITLWSDEKPSAHVSVAIGCGMFSVSKEAPWYPGGQRRNRGGAQPWEMDWTTFSMGTSNYRGVASSWISVGLWPLVLGCSLAAGVLVWSARRSRVRLGEGQCAGCGYVMVKQVSGDRPGELVCPECGPGAVAAGAKRGVRAARRPRGVVWLSVGVSLCVVAAVVGLVWTVSLWWSVYVSERPWVVEVGGGAVRVREWHEDNGDGGDEWSWTAIESDWWNRVEWRSNVDGYPNGPAFWSWSYAETGQWRHMVVLWPVWLGAGAVGWWMVRVWRRGRGEVK